MYFPLNSLPRAHFNLILCEALCQTGLKICFNDHGTVTKMAAVRIDVENHLKTFFRRKKALKLSLNIEHCG